MDILRLGYLVSQMLCLWAEESVGLKSWSETAYLPLASDLSLGCLWLYLSGTSGSHVFFCSLMISVTLGWKWSVFTCSPPRRPPRAARVLLLSLQSALLAASPQSGSRGSNILSVRFFSPRLLCYLTQTRVNHSSEGGLCVTFILSLSWLLQRWGVYSSCYSSQISLLSALTH